MVEATAGTDMGIGLSMAFALLAVGAAVAMALTVHDQVIAAGAFGAAVTLGVLAVAAPHVFGDR